MLQRTLGARSQNNTGTRITGGSFCTWRTSQARYPKTKSNNMPHHPKRICTLGGSSYSSTYNHMCIPNCIGLLCWRSSCAFKNENLLIIVRIRKQNLQNFATSSVHFWLLFIDPTPKTRALLCSSPVQGPLLRRVDRQLVRPKKQLG